MFTLDQLIEDPSVTREEFASRHPYPFLVLTPPFDDLDRDSSVFDTKQVEEAAAEVLDGRVQKFLSTGVPLRRGASGTFVYAIRKRAVSGNEPRVTIGRAVSCDIVIDDLRLSKVHAYFFWDEEGRCRVRDAGSRNGTRVDGHLLEQGESVVLSTGNQLELGPILFVYAEAPQLYTRIRTSEIS